MKINLELYGPLTDITKIKHFELDGVNDTESLVKELHKQFPALERSAFIVAVDNTIINKNTGLSENSIVALMPPYSGG